MSVFQHSHANDLLGDEGTAWRYSPFNSQALRHVKGKPGPLSTTALLPCNHQVIRRVFANDLKVHSLDIN